MLKNAMRLSAIAVTIKISLSIDLGTPTCSNSPQKKEKTITIKKTGEFFLEDFYNINGEFTGTEEQKRIKFSFSPCQAPEDTPSSHIYLVSMWLKVKKGTEEYLLAALFADNQHSYLEGNLKILMNREAKIFHAKDYSEADFPKGVDKTDNKLISGKSEGFYFFLFWIQKTVVEGKSEYSQLKVYRTFNKDNEEEVVVNDIEERKKNVLAKISNLNFEKISKNSPENFLSLIFSKINIFNLKEIWISTDLTSTQESLDEIIIDLMHGGELRLKERLNFRVMDTRHLQKIYKNVLNKENFNHFKASANPNGFDLVQETERIKILENLKMKFNEATDHPLSHTYVWRFLTEFDYDDKIDINDVIQNNFIMNFSISNSQEEKNNLFQLKFKTRYTKSTNKVNLTLVSDIFEGKGGNNLHSELNKDYFNQREDVVKLEVIPTNIIIIDDKTKKMNLIFRVIYKGNLMKGKNYVQENFIKKTLIFVLKDPFLINQDKGADIYLSNSKVLKRFEQNKIKELKKDQIKFNLYEVAMFTGGGNRGFYEENKVERINRINSEGNLEEIKPEKNEEKCFEKSPFDNSCYGCQRKTGHFYDEQEQKCFKCNEESRVNFKMREPYCKTCFNRTVCEDCGDYDKYWFDPFRKKECYEVEKKCEINDFRYKEKLSQHKWMDKGCFTCPIGCRKCFGEVDGSDLLNYCDGGSRYLGTDSSGDFNHGKCRFANCEKCDKGYCSKCKSGFKLHRYMEWYSKYSQNNFPRVCKKIENFGINGCSKGAYKIDNQYEKYQSWILEDFCFESEISPLGYKTKILENKTKIYEKCPQNCPKCEHFDGESTKEVCESCSFELGEENKYNFLNNETCSFWFKMTSSSYKRFFEGCKKITPNFNCQECKGKDENYKKTLRQRSIGYHYCNCTMGFYEDENYDCQACPLKCSFFIKF